MVIVTTDVPPRESTLLLIYNFHSSGFCLTFPAVLNSPFSTDQGTNMGFCKLLSMSVVVNYTSWN